MTDPSILPLVDMVIPIHDTSRPLQRTIDSLMQSGLRVPEELRITVVSHNIPARTVKEILSPEHRERVRILEFNDGEPSPAGAFMYGIRHATAEFVSIMGSDDMLEANALSAWWDAAVAKGLTVLIPPERHASGTKVATPPVRPWRRGVLHPLRDRLAYRTAPLGLIRRTAIDELGLDMPPRLRSGSDQLFGLKLWFSGHPVAYGSGLPRYVVGADAKSRVTFTVRRAEEELRAVHELVTDSWTLGLSRRERRAIVTKSLRVHVFSAALVRTEGNRWNDEDRAYIRRLIEVFGEVSPDFAVPLSLADTRLLNALRSGAAPPDRLAKLLAARRRYGWPSTIMSRHVRGLLATDGPLRLMVAARLL